MGFEFELGLESWFAAKMPGRMENIGGQSRWEANMGVYCTRLVVPF